LKHTNANDGSVANCPAADSNKSLAIRMPSLMERTFHPLQKQATGHDSQPSPFASLALRACPG